MGKIKDSFDHYIEKMYDGRDNISDERYSEEKRCFYVAYASCYEFFKYDVSNLSHNKALFEVYMLEREFKEYLQNIADQIHDALRTLKEKNERE